MPAWFPVIWLQQVPDAATAPRDRDTGRSDATVICRRPTGQNGQGNVGLDVGRYPVACSLKRTEQRQEWAL